MPIVWRSIPGFSMFEASSDGRVRRIAYAIRGAPPRPLPHDCERHLNGRGYVVVNVRQDGSYQHPHHVHKLVALAFFGPPLRGFNMVCHKDGNKQNNTPENLYWGNHKTNAEDRSRHGRTQRWKGLKHPTSKLEVDDVLTIKKLLAGGHSITGIAKQYGVSQPAISAIKSGQNWAWAQ